MDLRGLVGRPRPFRELVVRPRPTATFPATFGVAALSTVAILSATLIGVSELGAVRGPSGHDGGRIMAVPQWPGSTSPFLGFGGAPAVTTPIPTTPNTTTLGSPAGEATEQSRPGSAVEAAGIREFAALRAHDQGVTVVSAALNTPSARNMARTAVMVAVVSTHPVARVLSVPSITPPATFVAAASAYPVMTLAPPPRVMSPAGVRTPPAHERADGTSRDTAKRGHATKARKHARAHTDARATRNT